MTGACDSISVVIRQTILQIYPPDNMRGRVAAVNGMFVSSAMNWVLLSLVWLRDIWARLWLQCLVAA